MCLRARANPSSDARGNSRPQRTRPKNGILAAFSVEAWAPALSLRQPEAIEQHSPGQRPRCCAHPRTGIERQANARAIHGPSPPKAVSGPAFMPGYVSDAARSVEEMDLSSPVYGARRRAAAPASFCLLTPFPARTPVNGPLSLPCAAPKTSYPATLRSRIGRCRNTLLPYRAVWGRQ